MRKIKISGIVGNNSTKWKGKLRQIIAACVVNISSISYGMALAWPTPSLPKLRTGNPALDGNRLSIEDEGWLGSLPYLGAIVASPLLSYLSQKFGRKIVAYVVVVPTAISWLPIILSESLYLFYVARFIMGLTLGGVIAFCPMYVAEVAEDNIRGAVGAIRGLLNTGAILFVFAIGPLVSIKDMAIICIIIPLIFTVTFFWFPESPMHLLRKGKTQEAMDSMLWFRGGCIQDAEEEISKLTTIVKESEGKSVSIIGLISSRGTRRAFIICVVLGASQQLSGLIVILNYSVSIFEIAGGSFSPETATIIIGSVQFIGSFACTFLLDIAGRKVLIIGSQIILFLSLGSLGVYFLLQHKNYDLTSVGLLPVICLGLFVFFLSFGIASGAFVVMSEMFEPEARGLATTAMIVSMWLSAFLTAKFYANVVDFVGIYGCFWLYSLVCIACTIFTIFVIPETKNRSLESILRELNGDVNNEEGDNVNNDNVNSER